MAEEGTGDGPPRGNVGVLDRDPAAPPKIEIPDRRPPVGGLLRTDRPPSHEQNVSTPAGALGQIRAELGTEGPLYTDGDGQGNEQRAALQAQETSVTEAETREVLARAQADGVRADLAAKSAQTGIDASSDAAGEAAGAGGERKLSEEDVGGMVQEFIAGLSPEDKAAMDDPRKTALAEQIRKSFDSLDVDAATQLGLGDNEKNKKLLEKLGHSKGGIDKFFAEVYKKRGELMQKESQDIQEEAAKVTATKDPEKKKEQKKVLFAKTRKLLAKARQYTREHPVKAIRNGILFPIIVSIIMLIVLQLGAIFLVTGMGKVGQR